ncbi:MAG TPA: hypothetical protein DCZ43_07090, partial [candidate division Zixibacteria bacterium]|nr:hypothetical protein [candidate division Zixibacteria bacterium]
HLVAGHIDGLLTAYTDSLGLTNGTTYYYKLTAFWQDSVESGPSNEAFATPVLGARMILNPLSYNVTAQVGGLVTLPLNISNPGGINLDYTIVCNTEGRLLKVSPNVEIPIKHGPDDIPVIMDKQNDLPEPHNPPNLFSRGGPDEFGYQWIDSDEPGGPTYEWIDITSNGQQIPITGDDETQGSFDIGFNFPFYGELFTSFNVCSNGWLSFTDVNHFYYNYPLPDPNSSECPMNLVAPFWDDFYPPDGGEYWYYSDGNECVISFINVMHITGGSPHSFQVVLKPNGMITFNYMEVMDPDQECTVGIQNSDGSIGLPIAYNQMYLHNEMAVNINTSWLSAQPTEGTIAPGGNFNASIIFDASALAVGVYTGTLTVTGNDAYHQVGQVSIPVTFHVNAVGIDEPAVDLPKEFGLAQNYPNPFNPTTEIEFALPTRAHVSLDIYNVMGQRVRALVNSNMDAGYKSILWNGADDGGNSVASGTYFYVLKAGDKVFTKKMTMLK